MKKLKLNCELQNNFYVSDKKKKNLKKNEHFAFILRKKKVKKRPRPYTLYYLPNHIYHTYIIFLLYWSCALLKTETQVSERWNQIVCIRILFFN